MYMSGLTFNFPLTLSTSAFPEINSSYSPKKKKEEEKEEKKRKEKKRKMREKKRKKISVVPSTFEKPIMSNPLKVLILK